jgi:1,4-dihydroxy-2-naphthoate octaprenyltransferase
MLFLSVPVGLLVANIVYTHSIMDYEPDREVGKMTFAVLLGSKRAMLIALFLLIFTVYSMIITSVILGYISYYYLITLLTLPHAIELYRLMSWFVREPSRQFTPKWWYGPTGDYSKLQTAQIDWFMVRWLLARNLLMFFCLALIAGTIIS